MSVVCQLSETRIQIANGPVSAGAAAADLALEGRRAPACWPGAGLLLEEKRGLSKRNQKRSEKKTKKRAETEENKVLSYFPLQR